MSDKTNKLITTSKKEYFLIVFPSFFACSKTNQAKIMLKISLKTEEKDKIKNIYQQDNLKITF